MIKMTVLYSYDKVVAKLSKVYGVSKQAVKDHFDDMNVELFYQTRKAFGRDYLHWEIKQSDIEMCRQWLNTHSKELVKDEAKRVRNSNGYVLDNRKDEPLHFNTQREVADFLGYKNVGFVIGKVYRGYELRRETTTETTTSNEKSSVPENNSIINTNPGESITNHTIDTDSTIVSELAKSEADIEPNSNYELKRETTSTESSVESSTESSVESSTESSVPENNSITNTNTGESITNHTIDTVSTSTSTDVANSGITKITNIADIANFPEHQPFILGDLESEPEQESKPKSDFESKINDYFEKYYGGLE